MNSLGQSSSVWKDFWTESSPESEIKMWDYYGLRPWILKYAARYGKVLEAGCGLGRYVFYLNALGIDIDGLDFEKNTIEYLNNWKLQQGFEKTMFIHGDICDLPYEDNSLSGYISLGVIEHFIEGPQEPLLEAFRVIRPGGIAIISTPSISWYIFYRDTILKGIKRAIKKTLGKKIIEPDFFQYWYTPKKLKTLVQESGLDVRRADGCDLLYSFIEANKYKISKWTDNSYPVKLARFLENTPISNFGSQSVTISIKVAEKMYCFFCGAFNAKESSLEEYEVPCCSGCMNKPHIKHYKRNSLVKFHSNYKILPPYRKSSVRICELSGETFHTDPLFEDFGFTKTVSPRILKDPIINMELSCTSLQPILRDRK